MIKAGITGGIGSGKTTCCKIFEELGVPVYYADQRAKDMYIENPEVKEQVIALLGKDAYNQNELQRKYIAGKVFTDKSLLKKLNAIIHPAVGEDYQKFLKRNAKSDYTLKEAAVMIESGSARNLDYLIVVTAPQADRIERIAKRDDASREDIKNRMENQLSDEERLKHADFIIQNTTLAHLREQVESIHEQLLKIAKG